MNDKYEWINVLHQPPNDMFKEEEKLVVKLVRAPNKGYNEIMQSLSVKFSFVKKDGDTFTEMFAPVKCRDFLGDVLHAEHTKTKFSIYGFSYDGTTQKIDDDMTRLVMLFPSEDTKKIFQSNMWILAEIEEEAGLFNAKFYDVEESPSVLIVEAPSFWQKTIWKISLFSFILKAMCYKYETNDWITELRKMGVTESKHMNQYDPENKLNIVLWNLHHDWTEGIYVNPKDVHDDNGIFALLKRNQKIAA